MSDSFHFMYVCRYVSTCCQQPPVCGASNVWTETSLTAHASLALCRVRSTEQGKVFMFGIVSKCSFRNNPCISNWQSSERGSVAAASLTDCAPYDVSQKTMLGSVLLHYHRRLKGCMCKVCQAKLAFVINSEENMKALNPKRKKMVPIFCYWILNKTMYWSSTSSAVNSQQKNLMGSTSGASKHPTQSSLSC